MATITIDNVEYDVDTLPEQVKTQLTNLRATEAELERQQALVTMLQAARVKYRELLRTELQNMQKKSA